MKKQSYPIFILGMLVSACAQMPKAIQEELPVNPSIETVRANIDDFQGQRVRWGGVIQEIKNLEARTIIEIVGKPLNNEGRPRAIDESPGRFLAVFREFIDPAIYTSGRLITVLGEVTGAETGEIGAFNYRYPVVHVDRDYLWPREIVQYAYPDPFFYDPWFYSWPYYRFSPFFYDPWLYPWRRPYYW
ncbi:Slp family lipoprotein [Nitrosococcus wardiae]|uniref:Slp family lipoprotein n=1 Tax=Nitrosococcus wardiae TaxID=1814290 RepID=A0A4P7BZZ1_9GAMM|nr:Slp family lipoprotein [Nitrosococcus wardiae]QBQ54016.1 Slp family lipoprotein [Nitrosococcus wardiae]